MADDETTAIDHLIDHVRDADASAVIVVDGNGDDVVATLLAQGWTWSDEPTVRCSGKRIRYLVPPDGWAASAGDPS